MDQLPDCPGPESKFLDAAMGPYFLRTLCQETMPSPSATTGGGLRPYPRTLGPALGSDFLGPDWEVQSLHTCQFAAEADVVVTQQWAFHPDLSGLWAIQHRANSFSSRKRKNNNVLDFPQAGEIRGTMTSVPILSESSPVCRRLTVTATVNVCGAPGQNASHITSQV